MTRRLLGSLLLLFSACGGDEAGDFVDMNGDGVDDRVVEPNNVTVVTPTRPLGFVAGTIRAAADETAISNARISLFGGGLSGDATSNDRGEFSFGPIAAGAAFSLHIQADGYADATLTGLVIDDVAGNFPTANGSLFVGPVGLLPADGNYAVQIVDDQGAAVPNADVIFEVTPRYLVGNNPAGAASVRVQTDVDGLARPMNMPNARVLPPRFTARLAINVSAVDLNDDGVFDLRGDSLILDDTALREDAEIPVMVLRAGGEDALRVIASNVGTLVDRAGAFSAIGLSDSIRVVFNKPIERDSVNVDLRDETGMTSLIAPPVVLNAGNIVSIDPSEDLVQGREYNLSLSVASRRDGVRETLTVATPFFARVDPNVALSITGRLRDVNMNGAWGEGGDVLELTSIVPIGRQRMSGGNAKLWVALDFNGSGVLGDAQGELPASGQPFPPELTIQLSEPVPGNGAGLSGLTRFFAPIGINLPVPLGAAAGGAAFEIRIEDQPLYDISGRAAPTRTTGTAVLQ